jgi:hypothetical protein
MPLEGGELSCCPWVNVDRRRFGVISVGVTDLFGKGTPAQATAFGRPLKKRPAWRPDRLDSDKNTTFPIIRKEIEQGEEPRGGIIGRLGR